MNFKLYQEVQFFMTLLLYIIMIIAITVTGTTHAYKFHGSRTPLTGEVEKNKFHNLHRIALVTPFNRHCGSEFRILSR
jgi:hypothetical protein